MYTRERELPPGDRCVVLQSVVFALSSFLSVERMRKVGDFRVSSVTTTTTTTTNIVGTNETIIRMSLRGTN